MEWVIYSSDFSIGQTWLKCCLRWDWAWQNRILHALCFTKQVNTSSMSFNKAWEVYQYLPSMPDCLSMKYLNFQENWTFSTFAIPRFYTDRLHYRDFAEAIQLFRLAWEQSMARGVRSCSDTNKFLFLKVLPSSHSFNKRKTIIFIKRNSDVTKLFPDMGQHRTLYSILLQQEYS